MESQFPSSQFSFLPPLTPRKKIFGCQSKCDTRLALPSSFSCARQERKEVYLSIWVPMMRHKATLAPIFPISGLWRPRMGFNGAKNKDSDMQWYSYVFYIFLKDLFYKISLGYNNSHNLMLFLWKLIKNSYSAIKNLKKLWLQAKFSNFWMPLVPIKNI